ncbi:MAG TPA: hypothetical protein VMY98_04535 [Anaerolineae bacterium]|nr:hypothetical protein [Anaerolineae bacterium]
MKFDEIKVEVPLGQRKYGDPYIRGRNGDFEITALRIHQWAEEESAEACGTVDIHGIGKRGDPIVGGFRCIRSENIDALCKAWIEARGGLVIMPDDDEVGVLVTTCSGVVEAVVLGRDLDQLAKLRNQYVGDRDPDKHAYAIERLEWTEMVAGESLLLVPTTGSVPDLAP